MTVQRLSALRHKKCAVPLSNLLRLWQPSISQRMQDDGGELCNPEKARKLSDG